MSLFYAALIAGLLVLIARQWLPRALRTARIGDVATLSVATRVLPGTRDTPHSSIQDVLRLLADEEASLSDVLKRVCEWYEAGDPRVRCTVALLDDAGRTVTSVVVGGLPQSFVDAVSVGTDTTGFGTASAALSRGTFVFACDIAADSSWVRVRDAAAMSGLQASWSLPVSANDTNVAVFTGFRTAPGRPDSLEIERSEEAAALIAIAISHHRARKALIETRTRLELSQQIARLGYWERDTSTHRFVITPEVGKLIGAPNSHAIEVPQLLEHVLEEDRPIVIGALTEVRENRQEIGPVHFRVRHACDGVRHVVVQRRTIRASTGEIKKVIGTVQDVTEQRQAAARLEQSEERFRMMAEHTGQLILDCWLEAGEVHCAGAIREILGDRAPTGTLPTDIWRRIVHPDDIQAVRQAIRRVLKGERVHVGCRMQRPDGVVLDVEVTSSAILNEHRWATRIIATVTNVSDRRRAEAERQRYLAQLAFLADAARKVNSVASVPDLLRTITEIARDLVNANVAVGRLLPDESHREGFVSVAASDSYASLTSSDFIGLASSFETACIDPIRRPRAALSDDEAVDTQALLASSGTLVVPLMSSAGSVRGEILVADKYDGDFAVNDERVLGQLADLAAIGMENARLYAGLEERVRSRTQELEQSNRELEAFSYSVSHDLRGPLRAISGFAGLLQERHYDHLDAESRHYLDRIQAGTLRMSSLIDDLLELGRVTRMELRREAVDLTALAETIATRLRERSPKRRAQIDIERGLAGRGDTRLLEIVLENLFDNAWKFTASRPIARVRFGVREVEGERAFFVEDNGVGFDARYAPNLFGVFQRLHSNADFPGTGVGLATVQRIVQRHGGRIWAEAELDRGATFYFTMAGE